MPNKIMWRITIYNLISSILNISWLLQLHYLVKNFKVDEPNNVIIMISTIIIFLSSILFNYYKAKKNINDVSKIILKMGLELWDNFLHLDYTDFKHQQRNTLVDMFMINFWRIRNGYQTLFLNTIPSIFTIILLLTFLIYIHPIIALIFIVFFIVLMFFQLNIYSQLSKRTNEFYKAWKDQSNNVGRWIDQYELIKLGRGKKNSTTEFENEFKYFIKKGDYLDIKKEKWIVAQSIILQVSRVGTLILVYFLYKNSIITLPIIFSAIIVLAWIQGQLSKMQSAIPILIEASNASNFYQDFLGKNLSKNLNIVEAKEDVEPIREIELQNVSFKYQSGRKILKNLSLKLEYGKVYLIKGKNGCGKTTMAKIILGLLTDYKGVIKINKQQIKKEVPKELKYRMSYLHQDFSLFYGSFKENYSFGLKETSSDYSKMIKTLLPEITDDNIHIGEKGEKLSGGQKQRLTLIREWGKSSDLYILDEPLNHLDKNSSDWLKDSILKKKKTAIIIIISHQLGFESIADEIKYIKEGRIVDTILTTP